MDQHKRSVTIELMGPDETVLAGGRYATDHLTVLEQALSRLPDRWRDKPILILADGAGYSHALIPARCSFKAPSSRSGFRSSTRPRRIRLVPKWAWQSASNADGDLREHADVMDITGLLGLSRWSNSCPGMPVIVRRMLPLPGATLDAFRSGTASATKRSPPTPATAGRVPGSPARAHVRVEDRIRTSKDTGLGRLPSRHQSSDAV